MTSEAQNYLKQLYKKDPRKFFEIENSSLHGITSAILNERALSPTEIEEIRHFIKNGNPKIVIQFKGDGISYDCIFIDEGLIDRFTNPEEEAFKKACFEAPAGVVLKHKNGNTTFHGEAFSGISEKRLREKLKEEEKKENFEECAKILKYAESKGWVL